MLTIDVRHLYQGDRLYRSSFRYGVRYYDHHHEVDSEISRLKEPMMRKARQWVTKKSREAVIFRRCDGRVVERFIYQGDRPVRLCLL
jgi:hypothetical protein